MLFFFKPLCLEFAPEGTWKLRDVYDGTEHRKHQEFLSDPANITLLLNTDGVAMYRSSTTSIRPVQLVISELPREHR